MSRELTPRDVYRQLGVRRGPHYQSEYDSRTIQIQKRFTAQVYEMMKRDAIIGRQLIKDARKEARKSSSEDEHDE
jgi:hypothetical protein